MGQWLARAAGPAPAHSRRKAAERRAAAIGACLGAAALLTGACAPPSPSDAGAPPLLLVANGLDGTISRLAAGTGRVVGPAVAAGPAPWRMVPGPRGAVLVQSATGSAGPSELTFVPPPSEATAPRPVLLGEHTRVVAIAGNGGRYATVIYRPSELGPGDQIPPCQVALIDLLDGGVERSYTLCTEREAVFSLAVGDGMGAGGASAADGAVAYVGLRRAKVPSPLSSGRNEDVLLLIDLRTGARLAAAALRGAPERLVWGPSPDHAGLRLYAVVRWPDLDTSDGDAAAITGLQYALLRFEPVDLTLESAVSLVHDPLWLTVAADGRRAVAVSGSGNRVLGTTVVGINLSTGAELILARLPGVTTGLLVTGDRVYVPRADGDEVWIGTLGGMTVRTVRVGQHPLGVALAASAASAAPADFQ